MARKNNTRERLTQVALSSLWGQSCGAVGVDAICRQAGVNKGSFYHFFSSKTAIILAALDEAWREIREEVIEPAFDPQWAPLERIGRLFRNVRDLQKRRQAALGYVPGCPFCNIGSELGMHEEDIRAKVEGILDRYDRYIEFALREACEAGGCDWEPGDAARFVSTCLNGAVLQAKIRNDPEAILKALPLAEKIFKAA